MTEESAPNFLWSFTHEFDNRFIYYLTCGVGIMFTASMVIAFFGNKKTAKVVNVSASDDAMPEAKLHKYTVIIETSNSIGVSCEKDTTIQIQLNGMRAKTRYYKLSAYIDDRFIFQRGNKDILLIKTQDVLGKITEIKIMIDNEKWRPIHGEVVKTSTGERYKVPIRVLHSDMVANAEAWEVYPVKEKTFCKSVCCSLFFNHHWLSPILVSHRFGAFTSVVNNLFLFVGIVSVLTSTLIIYIIVSPDDGEDFTFDEYSFLWCLYLTILIFIIIAILDLVLRNVRSGYVPDVNEFLGIMKDNEIKPRAANPLHAYLERKNFNFGTIDNIWESPSLESFYSDWGSEEGYEDRKNQELMHNEDHFKSCIEFHTEEEVGGKRTTNKKTKGPKSHKRSRFYEVQSTDSIGYEMEPVPSKEDLKGTLSEALQDQLKENESNLFFDQKSKIRVKSNKYFGKGPLAKKLKKGFINWKTDYVHQRKAFYNEIEEAEHDDVSDANSVLLEAVTISPPRYPSEIIAAHFEEAEQLLQNEFRNEKNNSAKNRNVTNENKYVEMKTDLKNQEKSGKKSPSTNASHVKGSKTKKSIKLNPNLKIENVLHFQQLRSVELKDQDRDCRASYSEEMINLKPVFSSLSNPYVSEFSQFKPKKKAENKKKKKKEQKKNDKSEAGPVSSKRKESRSKGEMSRSKGEMSRSKELTSKSAKEKESKLSKDKNGESISSGSSKTVELKSKNTVPKSGKEIDTKSQKDTVSKSKDVELKAPKEKGVNSSKDADLKSTDVESKSSKGEVLKSSKDAELKSQDVETKSLKDAKLKSIDVELNSAKEKEKKSSKYTELKSKDVNLKSLKEKGMNSSKKSELKSTKENVKRSSQEKEKKSSECSEVISSETPFFLSEFCRPYYIQEQMSKELDETYTIELSTKRENSKRSARKLWQDAIKLVISKQKEKETMASVVKKVKNKKSHHLQEDSVKMGAGREKGRTENRKGWKDVRRLVLNKPEGKETLFSVYNKAKNKTSGDMESNVQGTGTPYQSEKEETGLQRQLRDKHDKDRSESHKGWKDVWRPVLNKPGGKETLFSVYNKAKSKTSSHLGSDAQGSGTPCILEERNASLQQHKKDGVDKDRSESRKGWKDVRRLILNKPEGKETLFSIYNKAKSKTSSHLGSDVQGSGTPCILEEKNASLQQHKRDGVDKDRSESRKGWKDVRRLVLNKSEGKETLFSVYNKAKNKTSSHLDSNLHGSDTPSIIMEEDTGLKQQVMDGREKGRTEGRKGWKDVRRLVLNKPDGKETVLSVYNKAKMGNASPLASGFSGSPIQQQVDEGVDKNRIEGRKGWKDVRRLVLNKPNGKETVFSVYNKAKNKTSSHLDSNLHGSNTPSIIMEEDTGLKQQVMDGREKGRTEGRKGWKDVRRLVLNKPNGKETVFSVYNKTKMGNASPLASGFSGSPIQQQVDEGVDKDRIEGRKGWKDVRRLVLNKPNGKETVFSVYKKAKMGNASHMASDVSDDKQSIKPMSSNVPISVTEYLMKSDEKDLLEKTIDREVERKLSSIRSSNKCTMVPKDKNKTFLSKLSLHRFSKNALLSESTSPGGDLCTQDETPRLKSSNCYGRKNKGRRLSGHQLSQHIVESIMSPDDVKKSTKASKSSKNISGSAAKVQIRSSHVTAQTSEIKSKVKSKLFRPGTSGEGQTKPQTNWSDVDVWIDRFGDAQMKFGEWEGSHHSIPERPQREQGIKRHWKALSSRRMRKCAVFNCACMGDKYKFSLKDVLSEMDGCIISLDEAGAELQDFIKQLSSFINSQLKSYRRRIQSGDIECFDEADHFVKKLIEKVMKCLSKYILDIAFQQGLTRPILKRKLANAPELEKDTLPSIASLIICAIIEECTERLLYEKSMTMPDLEEISRKLMDYACMIAEVFDQKLRIPDVRISQHKLLSQFSSHGSLSGVFPDKPVTKALTGIIELKYSPDKREGRGIIESLTEKAFYTGIGDIKYRTLYTLAACVVRLAFFNQDWVLQEDWNKIGDSPTPLYLDHFFKRQQKELLTVWRLCSKVTEEAQQELNEEYNDGVFVYTQFLVRKLTLSRIEELSKDKELSERCLELKEKLLKQWRKQGFIPNLNALHYLPEILMCNYLSHALNTDLINVNDETSPYFVLTRNSILERIENSLELAIHKRLKENLFCYGGKLHFLSHEDRMRSLMDCGDFLLSEHTEIMVDQAVEEEAKILPGIRDEMITEERIQFAASRVVRQVIDKARYICLTEKQNKLQNKLLRRQKEVPVVLDKQLKSALEELKPVLNDIKLGYAKERTKNIIHPEVFVDVMENKHLDFVRINFQRVVDACYILDDEALDKTITPHTLQELEWEVTGENRKCIPHFVKTMLMYILFIGVLLALVYNTYIGGQLNETEIKEWMVYWLICQLFYGFGLLPILALIVGIMTFIRDKCNCRNT